MLCSPALRGLPLAEVQVKESEPSECCRMHQRVRERRSFLSAKEQSLEKGLGQRASQEIMLSHGEDLTASMQTQSGV